MAFVHITDTKGETHLIHTSQIGLLPNARPARSLGSWQNVWAQMDVLDRANEAHGQFRNGVFLKGELR